MYRPRTPNRPPAAPRLLARIVHSPPPAARVAPVPRLTNRNPPPSHESDEAACPGAAAASTASGATSTPRVSAIHAGRRDLDGWIMRSPMVQPEFGRFGVDHPQQAAHRTLDMCPST